MFSRIAESKISHIEWEKCIISCINYFNGDCTPNEAIGIGTSQSLDYMCVFI